MSTKQIIAYGGTMERSADGGTTWDPMPEVKGIAIPSVETDYVEVTSLDSPNGFKEYLPALKDAGVITLTTGYTAAGYAQQLADNALEVPILYRATLRSAPDQSSGDVFEFSGFPTPMVEGNDLGNSIDMTISIRTTGNVSWTRGTAA